MGDYEKFARLMRKFSIPTQPKRIKCVRCGKWMRAEAYGWHMDRFHKVTDV